MVHYAQQRGLKYLSLNKGRLHGDNRLVREGNLSLLHCIDIAREAHPRKIFPELGVVVAREELLEERLRFVAHRENHLDDLLGSAHDSPVVVFGSNPVEHVENGHGVFPAALIEGFSHRVLVLVRAICNV